ncbi:MAG: Gfo/Idh/MocA family protein [Phycisphaerales bacterium JB054]
MRTLLALLAVLIASVALAQPGDYPEATPVPQPLRLVVIGLTHGHVHGALAAARDRDDIELVGVWDPRRDLFDKFAERYRIDGSLYFSDLEAMLDQTRPEAASVMTSTAGHLLAVEACAPRGVHTLVEKPLAVSIEDADRMAALASEHGVMVLTNYETSWYASVHEAYARRGGFGPIRRIVARHGHKGPREIGCSEEFLDWLTDPEANGAGALFDFGCYGAVLSTWLLDGQRPESVTAVTRQNKPDIYPQVDDDATIVLAYDGAVAVLQASWCWTHDVKEIDVFGEGGSVYAGRWNDVTVRAPDARPESPALRGRPGPYANEWSYLRAVVRGECEVDPLSSLELNRLVVEILDAARVSARTGRAVPLDR